MRKLWNRSPLPVWSLVTKDEKGMMNMNICTYVSAVSLEPKLMMVAVYHNTKTHDNCAVGSEVLLQLLSSDQAKLVRLLGQTTGRVKDKITLLKKRELLSRYKDWSHLTEVAGFMVGKIESIVTVGGDHDLAILRVTTHKNLRDTPVLTTEILRAEGLIR